MPIGLEIALLPERLDEGSPEEKAAFGLLTISTPTICLTDGFDFYINSYRHGPLVSGYHAAEWFAWNWWRLRWEPRSGAHNWLLAHKMTSIGEGYIWPNIEVFSDGFRTALISDPSARPAAKPFRFVGAPPVVIPSTDFESAIDSFIPQVLERLRDEGLGETNLARVWRDVLAERAAPEIAKRRRLEALLGRNPNSIEDDAIEVLLTDAGKLGETAIDELAASHAKGGRVATAADLEQLARTEGYDASPRDAVRLSSEARLPRGSNVAAWRLGAEAAKELRAQERLHSAVITDHRLEELAGTSHSVLGGRKIAHKERLSFTLDFSVIKSRVVLGSKWRQGRRFNLARLIGDRLVNSSGALHPATYAYTYRQKMQRSFAAEFLCPFAALDDMLDGDYSPEAQQEAADHFQVSEMTVRTLLVNHKRLERDDLDEDFEVAAA